MEFGERGTPEVIHFSTLKVIHQVGNGQTMAQSPAHF